MSWVCRSYILCPSLPYVWFINPNLCSKCNIWGLLQFAVQVCQWHSVRSHLNLKVKYEQMKLLSCTLWFCCLNTLLCETVHTGTLCYYFFYLEGRHQNYILKMGGIIFLISRPKGLLFHDRLSYKNTQVQIKEKLKMARGIWENLILCCSS